MTSEPCLATAAPERQADPPARARPSSTPAGPNGMPDSSSAPLANVPPPPAPGALVGTTVLVEVGVAVGPAATTRRVALPVSLVPSHLTLTA
ncbi:hypothetical protein [Nonomuraea recticatena]|uniref:hypothetical protein n=1 Tax=Nonomuraea recticatena TaxID=46178 RepID=UPI003606BAF5